MNDEGPRNHHRRLKVFGDLVRRGSELLWPERGSAEVDGIGGWVETGKWRLLGARIHFESGERERITITAGPPERTRSLYHRYYVDSPPAEGRAALLEPECLMFESYPADWKLNGLRHAIRADHVAPLLSESGLSIEDPGQVSIRIRRYLAHKRAVIEYRVPGTAGAVGKLYSSGNRSERAFDVLRRIRAAGEPGTIAPKPYLLRRNWSFVLMERLPGAALEDLIDSQPEMESTLEAVKATAHSLALLHTVPVKGKLERSWRAEVEVLTKATARLHGDFAADIGVLLEALAAYDVPDEALVFAHGDFNPRQVLWHEGRAFIVDLDRGAPGEASADVGRFVAALKGRLATTGNERYRVLAELFEQEYEAVTGRQVRGRSAAQEATAILHRAVRLLRSRRPERMPSAAVLADEARRTLANQGLL